MKLRDWRTKHEKRVTYLEKKLTRLQEWSKYKPDKLLFELQKLEDEIARRKRALERGPGLLEKTKVSVDRELKRAQTQLKIQEHKKVELEKSLETQAQNRNLDLTREVEDEDLIAVMEENQRLRDENDALQQRLAELSLQMAAVSETVINGRKIKASRLDSMN